MAVGFLPGAHYWALCLIVDTLEKRFDANHSPARQDLDITVAKDILKNPFRGKSNDMGNLYSVAWGRKRTKSTVVWGERVWSKSMGLLEKPIWGVSGFGRIGSGS